jgi:hypothetical protein
LALVSPSTSWCEAYWLWLRGSRPLRGCQYPISQVE